MRKRFGDCSSLHYDSFAISFSSQTLTHIPTHHPRKSTPTSCPPLPPSSSSVLPVSPSSSSQKGKCKRTNEKKPNRAHHRSSPTSPPSFLRSLSRTGYIGGTVLSEILKKHPESTITVQYRQDAHKDVLEKFSKQIVPVKGELGLMLGQEEGGSSRSWVVGKEGERDGTSSREE